MNTPFRSHCVIKKSESTCFFFDLHLIFEVGFHSLENFDKMKHMIESGALVDRRYLRRRKNEEQR